jgi:hypothetical protein
MQLDLNGGCACGQVRYRCRAEPILANKCHCRDCQRATGSAYAPLIWIYEAELALEGTPLRYHTVTADSGRDLRRGFCPDCGSPLLVKPAVPGIAFIVASSLDDPSVFAPSFEIWTARTQPWDLLDPNLRHFAGHFTPDVLPQSFLEYFASLTPRRTSE